MSTPPACRTRSTPRDQHQRRQCGPPILVPRKITGDVDFMFGDAAAVFDHTTIYTVYHGTTATGTETIQPERPSRTGGAGDYLSGYVDEQRHPHLAKPGMTNLYFGRPYGTYSTSILLNSYIDQGECGRLYPVSPPC